MWNKEQQQIIWGTLLGKSYITQIKRRNYFLTVPESEDLNWLKYKAYMIEQDTGTIIKDGKRSLWRSKCAPAWNEIRKEFYGEQGKKVKMEILDHLWDVALGTWFLDKGGYMGKRIYLGTTVFGLDGNAIIAKYFNEVGIPCDIKKERNTGKIVFTNEGTKVFLETVAHTLPDFMHYRLKP